MKKIYKKPLIMVEELNLDHAIAANCTANREIMESLVNDFLGFTESMDCTFKFYEKEGEYGLWQDTNMDGVGDTTVPGSDTVCYHSNIGKPFYS